MNAIKCFHLHVHCRGEMAMLLQLSLCLVTVMQVTSSQAACDVTKRENDGIQIVVNCGCSEQNDSICCQRNEQLLGQLVTTVSQMQTTISQLLSDVAELKSCGRQNVTGSRGSRWKSITSV